MPDLNRTTRLALRLTAMLDSEAQVSTHRAGFSVIVLGEDESGIERGFGPTRYLPNRIRPSFLAMRRTQVS